MIDIPFILGQCVILNDDSNDEAPFQEPNQVTEFEEGEIKQIMGDVSITVSKVGCEPCSTCSVVSSKLDSP